MSLLAPLVSFELRQAIPGADGEVADFVARRLAKPADPLAPALAFAAERTWRGLAAALAAGRLSGPIRAGGAADAAQVEDQLRRFTDAAARCLGNVPDGAGLAALAEWRDARQGCVGLERLADDDLAPATAAEARYDDAEALLTAAGRAEALVAQALAGRFPSLGRILRGQAGVPPLLAALFAYFFRREVESNEELSGELLCDGLRRLSAPLAGGMAALSQALARLGSRFDGLIDAVPAAALPAPLAARPTPFLAAKGAARTGRGRSSVNRRAAPEAVTAEPPPLARQAARPSAAGRRPGPGFINALGMQFVWVPPGDFVMGSGPGEEGRDADERPHPVRITRGYFLGAHPVTRGQFAAFVRVAKYVTDAERQGGAHRGPSGEWRLDPWCNWKHPDFPQDDDHPVVCVSWNDARAFCGWLAARDDQKEGIYRLPTEAEWEHACRAGTTTAFWPGEALHTDQANYDGRGGGAGLFREGTTPTWVFAANPWGLFDLHGNVWEWCADWYGPYPAGAAADPQGPAQGGRRVLRGGSWRNQARFLRSAARNQMAPSGRDRDAGFRVCLVV